MTIVSQKLMIHLLLISNLVKEMVDRFNPNRIILSTNKHNMSCSNTAAEILSVYKI